MEATTLEHVTERNEILEVFKRLPKSMLNNEVSKARLLEEKGIIVKQYCNFIHKKELKTDSCMKCEIRSLCKLIMIVELGLNPKIPQETP